MEAAILATHEEPSSAPKATESQLDFNLHGLVGIRLINASPADRSAVSAQLGPISDPIEREPDIVVRFVERLRVSSPVRLLGQNDVGYTKEAFLLLRGKHKIPVRVQMPFDTIGTRCEIVCERGLPAVPLLLSIVNLTVLNRGGLAMHGSAFRYAETDVLVTGWSKGGKTEVLLGFTANGAQYIGDEWIYISRDRERIFGIPEPIRVWDWHLEQLPRYWNGLGRRQRLNLKSLRILTTGLTKVIRTGENRPSGWQRRAGRFVDLLDRQRYTHLEPKQTFKEQFGPLQGSVKKVILVASHDSPETTVHRIEPEEIADRMVFSLEEERAGLMSYYRMFRFAFPDKSNPLLDNASAIEHARLLRFLKDKECYAVYHPYPPSISDLFNTIRPTIEA